MQWRAPRVSRVVEVLRALFLQETTHYANLALQDCRVESHIGGRKFPESYLLTYRRPHGCSVTGVNFGARTALGQGAKLRAMQHKLSNGFLICAIRSQGELQPLRLRRENS